MKRLRTLLVVFGLMISMSACSKTTFTLMGDEIITVEALSEYVDPGYFIDHDIKVTINNPVDTTIPGTYVVTYSAKIGSEITTLYRSVNVIDTVDPVLTLKGSLTKSVCSLLSYNEEGFSAFDNVDQDISDKVIISSTEGGLLYSVKDSSGNLTEMTRQFTIADTQRPSISLSGPSVVKMDINGKYYEFGYHINDNCGISKSSVRISSNLDVTVAGRYTMTYSVTDRSGNSNSVTRIIEVSDLPQTTVYLTFDDGPNYTTISILKTLKQYDVKATFFVLWHYGHYSELIQQAYQDGHTIGLHSYTHNYKAIYASTDAFFNDLNKISDYVYGPPALRPKTYRSLGGSSNTVSHFNPGIMTTLAQLVQDQGYQYYDWNVSSADTAVFTESGVVNNVINGIRIGRSNIVLMHDSTNHAHTALALPHILEYLKSINAVLLPITMDTPTVHLRIAN